MPVVEAATSVSCLSFIPVPGHVYGTCCGCCSCVKGFWSYGACFAGITGMGVGAYNAEVIKPCITETLHLTHQKGVPVAKHISNKTVEGAKLLHAKTKEHVIPAAYSAYDKAKEKMMSNSGK
mmetsp:Transcript_57997/g.101617  ORF Transcript_57997/g.101617 Transcript_57997/m.101617 type:complete len:122 (-) Transcript_57997:87-452(-)